MPLPLPVLIAARIRLPPSLLTAVQEVLHGMSGVAVPVSEVIKRLDSRQKSELRRVRFEHEDFWIRRLKALDEESKE